jgi:hypothetical protein
LAGSGRKHHQNVTFRLFTGLLCNGNIAYFFHIIGLNQYTIRNDGDSLPTLRSPKISEHNACFTFQYAATSNGDGYSESRTFVLVRIANNNQSLPLWTNNAKDERGEWRTVNILLSHKSGINQVNRLFVKILFEWIPRSIRHSEK